MEGLDGNIYWYEDITPDDQLVIRLVYREPVSGLLRQVVRSIDRYVMQHQYSHMDVKRIIRDTMLDELRRDLREHPPYIPSSVVSFEPYFFDPFPDDRGPQYRGHLPEAYQQVVKKCEFNWKKEGF